MALYISTITYTAYYTQPIHAINVCEENLTLSFLLVQWRIRPWALLLCGFVGKLSEHFYICDSVFHTDLIGNMPLSYWWEENKIWAFTYTTFWITSANVGTYLDFFVLFFIFANMSQNVKNNPKLHKWVHPRSTNCYWMVDDSMCQTVSIFVGDHSVAHNGHTSCNSKNDLLTFYPPFVDFQFYFYFLNVKFFCTAGAEYSDMPTLSPLDPIPPWRLHPKLQVQWRGCLSHYSFPNTSTFICI